jgi:hypothetical protein
MRTGRGSGRGSDAISSSEVIIEADFVAEDCGKSRF